MYRGYLNRVAEKDMLMAKIREEHPEKIYTSGAQGQQPDDSLTTEASGATGKSPLRPERPVCATQCPGRLVYQLLRSEYLVLHATSGLQNAL